MTLVQTIFFHAPEIPFFLSLAIGFWIGQRRIGSFQLGGVAGSLFAAVAISQIGVTIGSDAKALLFALFIYAVGFQNGPQFFRSLGRDSLREIALAFFLAASALLTVVALAKIFHLDKGMAAGIASGALTQSAMIGTAGSALTRMPLAPDSIAQLQGHVAVGYAVTYLFGCLGPIFVCTQLLPRLYRRTLRDDALSVETSTIHDDYPRASGNHCILPELVGRCVRLSQPSVTLSAIEAKGLTVEKILRDGVFQHIEQGTTFCAGDILLIYGHREAVIASLVDLGEEIADVPGMNIEVAERRFRVCGRCVSGQSLRSWLDQIGPETRHGAYLVCAMRGGKEVAAREDICPQAGDVLTFRGLPSDLQKLGNVIGPQLTDDLNTDWAFHGLGIVVGLVIGSLVFHCGGVPLTLGSGGGALLSGLLFGFYHSRHQNTGAMPKAAAALLIDFGLAGFVAIIGLQTGRQAVVTIYHAGIELFLIGVVVTMIPMILTLYFGRYVLRYSNTAIFAGALAGARSANPAFGEVLGKAGNTVPTTPFAVTYAIANILLTLLGPLIVALA